MWPLQHNHVIYVEQSETWQRITSEHISWILVFKVSGKNLFVRINTEDNHFEAEASYRGDGFWFTPNQCHNVSSSWFPCETSTTGRGLTAGKGFREIWEQFERNRICPLWGFMWLLQLPEKTLEWVLGSTTNHAPEMGFKYFFFELGDFF